MRSILLLILGLAVGALAAVKISSVLNMRDAYPRGVMQVMGHHMGGLVGEMRSGKCPVDATQMHLASLKAMQPEIMQAFAGDLASKPDFQKHKQKLTDAVDAAIAAAPADCKALKPLVAQIGGSCKSCHEVYR